MLEFISTVRIMRYLLFDPFHGAAGDMVTAALLSLGADQEPVIQAMQSVVSNPTIRTVEKKGIKAIQVKTHANSTKRTLEEVLERVRRSEAPAPAIDMAVRVFKRISDAENAIHGMETHFHEVGADDAIADVIGSCTALHILNPDGVSVQPIAVGGGTIQGSHGIMPIPAPATLEILKNTRLGIRFGTMDDGELCTPTGAALLAEFKTLEPEKIGPATVSAVGYGAGTRDTPHVPNVLRVVLLEGLEDLSEDFVDVLETNVDDASGEVIGNAITALMNAGARDASAIPCIMKKGRAGYLIRVICHGEESGRLAKVMAEELGTLGIRCSPFVHRFIADRSVEIITTEIAGQKWEVPVKCGWMGGHCYIMKAEFDNVLLVAGKSGLPAREVARIIEDNARRLLQTRPAGEHNGTGKISKRKS
jgi:pyridinium-3,5-bisthiocarboxylic acid mononucleotide nickel chelatase